MRNKTWLIAVVVPAALAAYAANPPAVQWIKIYRGAVRARIVK